MRIHALLTLLLLMFLLRPSFIYAQQPLRVIQANAVRARITEGTQEASNWRINPRIRPDIHVMTKTTGPAWVSFVTDMDSMKIQLAPGEQVDFIVLLQGKDSCYTRIECPALKNYYGQLPAAHDTIPFTLTAFNNIKIKTVLNHTDTLDLIFDSGSTGLLLTDSALKNKAHTAHTDKAVNHLQIGSLRWDSLLVYPVVLSGQGTDGCFGWDLFDGKLVEIDYDKSIFIVHTRLSKPALGYAAFNMEYIHTLFCIRGDLEIKKQHYTNRFLFDNGYQRTIMLDTVLMQEQHYPRDLPVIKKVIMHNAEGKPVPVITVSNERFNLGTATLLNIPVQLMATGNPARFKTHILGNEVLKRFNTILDFQNNLVYLQPNSLFNLAYKDAD
jgi:hypothetical protein